MTVATLDPPRLHRRLVAGRLGSTAPSRLTGARTATDAAARELDSARCTLDAAWTGGTSRAAQRALEGRCDTLLAADAELAVAQAVLVDLARAQAEVRDAADRVLLHWLVTVASRGLADPVGALRATAAACHELLALQRHLDGELARTAAAFDALAGGAVAAAPVAGSVPLPPTGSDPREVARWWAGLRPSERTDLEHSAPDALAALTGLPPRGLDRVNRARLARDVAGASVENGAAPGRRAAMVSAALATTEAMAGSSGPVLLLRYSPEEERGMVVAVGDLSTADDVALTVPGTGSSVRAPSVEQAAALRAQMDADDPGRSHAVVQWVDYRAPESLHDPAVAQSRVAARAAEDLVTEVQGWRAASAAAAGTATQHVTAVGHSYGSVVVGLAAARGLPVDEVVLLGSPGAGVDSAAELSPGVGHVWAAAAEHDPVVQATAGSWFSPGATVGPYDPEFGARLFAADDPASLLGAHSTYFEPGSTSLRNIAAIATGDADEVSTARADGPVEAIGQLLGHLGTGLGALVGGDLYGTGDAARAGFGDLVGDTGDTVLGGLGEAGAQLRGLERFLDSAWDALG